MTQTKRISQSVWCLDTEHRKANHTASYLLINDGQAALIDCGVNRSIEILLRQIKQIGVELEQIVAVCLTHAHLDHAGGAGLLMNHLPNATVYAHEDTIRHLVNTEKLEQGVRAVYGDAFYDQQYGSLIPLDQNRCQSLVDQESIILGGKKITAVYTPGHAWHHHAFYCSERRTLFAGDAFGIALTVDGLFSIYFPATPPSQFSPQDMLESFDKILNTGATSILITHYGAIKDPKKTSQILKSLVQKNVDLITLNHTQNLTTLKRIWVELLVDQIPQHIRNDRSNTLLKQTLSLIEDEAELHLSGLQYWMKKRLK